MSWFTKKRPDGSKSDGEDEAKSSPQTPSQPQPLPQVQMPPQPAAGEEDTSGANQTQYKGVHGLYNPLAWENMPKSLRDQFPHWKDASSVTAAGTSAGEESERKFQFSSSFKQPENTIPYVVMEHDTMNSIALKFDSTPSQLAHLNRKQLGMVSLIPGEAIEHLLRWSGRVFGRSKVKDLHEVLYVPDSQRGEGEDGSSSLFSDDVSPKSAPPELKTFQFPGAQKPGVDAAGPEGTAAPGAAAAAGNVTATQGDAREVRSASPKLCSASDVEITSIPCTYVTEDQGCIRGSLVFSPSAIHFRPDPADRLVQENGEDSYDIQLLIQDLVYMGLSGDPHCAVNQRARKPPSTAQATVTQEERGSQPQALSDNPQSAVASEGKMAASGEHGVSRSSSSRLGPKEGSPVQSTQDSPSMKKKESIKAQGSSPMKRESVHGPKDSALQGKEAVPQTTQDGSLQGKEAGPQTAQDGSLQGKEAGPQTPQDGSLQGKEAGPQTTQDGSLQGKEAGPQTPQDGSLQGKEAGPQTTQDGSLQGKEAGSQTAQDGSLQGKEAEPQTAQDGSLQAQGSPDQGKAVVTDSNEQKPLSVKDEGPAPVTAGSGTGSGIETTVSPKEGHESVDGKGTPSGIAVSAPVCSDIAAAELPSPITPVASGPTLADFSSPSKPTEWDTTATISTPVKDSCPAPIGATLAGHSTPVVFEVGTSPLKRDAASSDSVGEATPSVVSTPVKDSLGCVQSSDMASSFDPDKTFVASEDPLVGAAGVERQGTPAHCGPDTLQQGVEECGACVDMNATMTGAEGAGEEEGEEGGAGQEVPLERSDNAEGKEEVVGANPVPSGPRQGWDERHEKCASPSSDDVRFLNVCISNSANQKYTYMPVTIGHSLPRHLHRRSFVRTGFCFAIPDSSIDGIVASVMRHHPSACLPAKQSRNSAIIINLEEPQQDLVISNEHYDNDWEIYSWGNDETSDVELEPLPVLRDKADLVDEKLVRQLSRELLPKAISCDWILLYSTFKHGISLQTLYRNVREYDEDSPLLLVARDEYHKRFGAMLSCTMKISTHFLGTGESYLFSVEEFGKLQVYPWSGLNDYFFQGNSDSVAFGSDEGHFGLWLHESLLRGSSSPCATFKNPCLSTKPEFECTGVEVWGFVRSH